MNNKVLYFGYGANRDARMIAAITGTPQGELKGQPAILRGYKLGMQKLNEITDQILPTAPIKISARDVIKRHFDDSFESYVIRKAGSEDRVSGTLWELTPRQREKVRFWELLDFGWYHDISITVETKDGKSVLAVSEALDNKQRIDRFVDGMDYPTWVVPPEDLERAARASEEEFNQVFST